ncbi:uncharacterized protein TNCV_3851881 [Trichonephila clavipes]|nr:uncharacterized protein TNCV_3851881 [Trichonephila clavipes]
MEFTKRCMKKCRIFPFMKVSPNLHQYSDALIVIDDLMGELGNDPQLTKLFVKFSHHRNLSIIFVVQNIFHKGKEIREISLNAHYLVLFKNRRDQSQITHLGRQLYPRKVKFFQECYADATSKPYGYLLIDLKPETDESLRVRTAKNLYWYPKKVQVTEHLSELDQRMKNILHNKDLTEEEKTILYLQVLQKYTHFSNENRRESEPVPNEASLSENQETESLKENLKESVVKTEKEVFEDEIFRIVPARYKEKAKNIFQF